HRHGPAAEGTRRPPADAAPHRLVPAAAWGRGGVRRRTRSRRARPARAWRRRRAPSARGAGGSRTRRSPWHSPDQAPNDLWPRRDVAGDERSTCRAHPPRPLPVVEEPVEGRGDRFGFWVYDRTVLLIVDELERTAG